MEWIKWLIPLIAIAVWILSQLAGNQQEQKRPSPRPLPPRDPDQDPRARRASEDLEEFLEKIKRRKDADERTAAEPVVLIAEEVAAPRPAPRRTAPPPLPRPVEQRRKSAPIGGKRPERRPEPVVLAEPISLAPEEWSRMAAMPTPAVPQAPQALPAAPAAPGAPQALHRPEALPGKASLPPAARLVRELLKSRQSLAAAVLLREVLDAPLCRRARRPSLSS